MRILALLLAACAPEGDASDTEETQETSDSEASGTCTARVTIAFYTDDACTNQVGSRVYDTSQACFSWTANGSNAGENSATRFQCYDDRLCYTQHADTLTCDDSAIGPTDKEARNGVCLKEPAGSLYSKLLGGNEDCPPAPEGFECPSSAAQEGTDAIEECSTE